MLDYRQYLRRGGTLTETKFQDAYRKALPLFDDITRYRREMSGWDALDETFADEVADALFELVERVPAIEEAKAKRAGADGIASFNNGVTSMSFRDAESPETAEETQAKRDVAAMLPLDLVGRCVEW